MLKLEAVLLALNKFSCHLHQVVLLVLSDNTTIVSYLTSRGGGDSLASALQPGVADFPTGIELGPPDTGSSYSKDVECPCRLPVEEETCPDRVSSGQVSVPGHGSAFWSVSSEQFAGDSS